MRKLFVFLLLISISLVLQPVSVFACSGPPTTLERLEGFSEHLIYGRIIESDIVRQSHLVQVESYITGGQGAEYILLAQNSPETTAGLIMGYYGGGDCNAFRRSPQQGEAFYMFISRLDDGFYQQMGGLFSESYYQFSTDERVYRIYLNDPESDSDYNFIEQDVNEEQFLGLMAEISGDVPTSPDLNAAFPAYQSILITSENGSHYVFPIDGREAIQVEPETLASYFAGYPYRLGYIYCQYGTLECTGELSDWRLVNLNIVERDYHVYLNRFNGVISSDYFGEIDDILLGDNGVSYTLWQDEQLQINYQRPIDLHVSAEVYGSDFSAWSDDGSLFAYSDADGLWLYTVLDANNPRVLIPTSEEAEIPPYAREFSSSGRYLLAHVDGVNIIYDLASDTSIAGDAISPNERNRLEIRNEYLYLNSLWATNSNEPYRSNVVKADFLSDNEFVMLICDEANNCLLEYRIVPVANYYNFYRDPRREDGRDFIISELRGDVAVLVDDSQIRLNGIDYLLELDSPIASIEWIPSRFLSHFPYQYNP